LIGRFETFTFSLSKISSSWNKIAAEELKPFGLKGAYVVYLITLYKNPDGLTSANLCEMCNKDKTEVSRAIAAMEEKGLVEGENTTAIGYRIRITWTKIGITATKTLC